LSTVISVCKAMIDRISAFCGSAWRNNSRCYMGRCRI